MLRYIVKSSLLLLIISSLTFAQLLSIQGVARTNEGQSLSDGTYAITFRLYTQLSGGSAAWTETQTLSVLNGVFSANLGAVESMASLDFNQVYWLSLEIENNGELSPRTQLTLSPYAIMGQLDGTTNVFPADGPVGIGTTSPAYKLHVHGKIYAYNGLKVPSTGVVIENSSNGRAIMQTGWISPFGDFTAINSGYDWDYGSEPISIMAASEGVFITRATTTGTPFGETLLKVSKTGNVGIGLTGPVTKFHLHDGTAQISKNMGYDAQGTYTALALGTNSHQSNENIITKFLFDVETTSAGHHNKLHIRGGKSAWGDDQYSIPTNKYDYMTFYAGNVGIGTISPGSELDVDGNIRLSGTHLIYNSTHGVIDWGGGNLYFRTNSTVGDPGTFDDEAWIENDGEIKASAFISIGYDLRAESAGNTVNPYEQGLERVMRLRPVNFEKGGGNRLGFYADELNRVIPEVVEDLYDGRMGIDYGALSVVAISAIQEQQEIIDRQQQEIDALKIQIQKLAQLVQP